MFKYMAGQLIDMDLKLYSILLLTFIFSIGVVRYIKWNANRILNSILMNREKLALLTVKQIFNIIKIII